MTQPTRETGARTIKVSALRQGTVIDHLRQGTGLKVLAVLGLYREGAIAIGLNLESKKLGMKDLIKIENRELSREEVNKIALLSPEATLSIIREFNVVAKFEPELAERLDGLIRCSNPACVSHHESVKSEFLVLNRRPLRVRCRFCERAITGDAIELI